MDENYYSEKTRKNFIKTNLCKDDPTLLRYYENNEIVKFRKNIEDWLWLLTRSSDRLRSLCSQMSAAIARWGIDGKIAEYRRNAARVMR